MKPSAKGARILLYDVETAPSLGWYFDPWKEGNILETEQEWFMLSFAWQWLGEKEIHVKGLCDYRGYKKDLINDEQLLQELHKLMSEADIVVGHNAASFDIKRANARFLFHGMEPVKPYKTIDTLKEARKILKGNSNKLDALARYFKIGHKLPHTGKDLWLSCVRGDLKAWKMMKEYNKHDVYLLEKVYLKLRPWMKNHPNLAIVTRELQTCPKCGSGEYWKNGTAYTLTGEAQRYKCKNCFGWYQGKTEKLATRIVNR
jgi:hypothetical protein